MNGSYSRSLYYLLITDSLVGRRSFRTCLYKLNTRTHPKIMLFGITRLLVVGLLVSLFSSCFRDHSSSSSRTTGLVDDLLTILAVRKDAVPVEIQSGSLNPTGYISAPIG